MKKIAFLGLGAMGSRMVPHLIRAGHQLTVWDRSATAPPDWMASGVTTAATPREAAANADIVISMVRDDQASSEVWLDKTNGALAGMRPHGIAIESSTLSPLWIESLAAELARAGSVLLDAPVSGSLPQAESAQLVFMVGGDPAAFEMALPVLSSMGSAVHHVGPSGQGSFLKLVVNAFLGIQVAAIGELLGLLAKAGLDGKRCIDIMATMPVTSTALSSMAKMMLAQDHAPRFPIALMAKDFRYTLAVAGLAHARTPLSAATLETLAQATEQGLGSQNITALARLFVPEP